MLYVPACAARPLALSLADVTRWLPCLSRARHTTRPETLPRDSRDTVCVMPAAIRLRAGKQATRQIVWCFWHPLAW